MTIGKHGLREITQPSCFRSKKNEGAADISQGYVVKYGTGVDGCLIASAATDNLLGVATETMQGTTNGVVPRSVQTSGKAKVVAGAAVSIGDRLTVDSSGRAITVTANTQSVLGTAETAASTAGDFIEVELTIGQNIAAGGIQRTKMQIEAADCTEVDTSQAFSFGTFPANAVFLGYEVTETTAFTDGAAGTFELDIGDGTTADDFADGLDIDAATPPNVYAAAIMKKRTAATAILATVKGSVNVSTATAGDITIELFWCVAEPTEVAAA